MKRWHRRNRVLASLVATVLIVAFAPVVLLFGEMFNRHYLTTPRLIRRRPKMAWLLLRNPVWIALTAPARWLADRLRPRAGFGRRRGGNGPPGAGVREPRRPMPDLPAGAMALPEPRSFD